MAFQVVHAEHRLVQRQAQAAGDRGAHQQGPGQARALGVGDRVDVGERHVGLGQRLLQQGDGAPDMVARGQLRHHAAVLLVHGDLGMQGVGEQAALGVVQGEAGFIAGRFNAENDHGRCKYVEQNASL